MGPLPTTRSDRVVRALRRFGYQEVDRSPHHVALQRGEDDVVVVPIQEEIVPRVLSDILTLAGIDRADFEKALK